MPSRVSSSELSYWNLRVSLLRLTKPHALSATSNAASRPEPKPHLKPPSPSSANFSSNSSNQKTQEKDWKHTLRRGRRNLRGDRSFAFGQGLWFLLRTFAEFDQRPKTKGQKPTMSYEHILIDETDGIVTITLNRPEKLNAFIGHMRRDLAEALEQAGSERSVRVVVITGAGRAFCAGGDVEFMYQLMERRDSEEFARILGAGRRVVLAIRQMTKPVIPAGHGVAAGAGCNRALACDFRIASTNASFTESFVRVGLNPDWGGTYFLPRLVTPNKACELFFLGDTIDASEAARLNIVNQVVH